MFAAQCSRRMKLRVFLLCTLLAIAAQTTPPIAITSPTSGAFLRGLMTITGTAQADNFLSAQLDFGYASDSTGTWFTLQTFSQPMQDSALATWDTASITDGDYILRLRVNLGDGTSQEVTVPVRIQNDTPIVTPTATALPPTATPEDVFVAQIPTPFLLAASPTSTDVPRPTPTALPTNPVSLNQSEIYSSLGRGALVIVGLFIFSGILLRLRRS
jgi:VCBS repeat-containing protein